MPCGADEPAEASAQESVGPRYTVVAAQPAHPGQRGIQPLNRVPCRCETPQPGSQALRFDLVAGLVAAAVVLPKAMAYATVAGLPVAVGLYTAFVPMVIYALLGSSRVLSVGSTTTLAILTARNSALVVPDGDPSKLAAATAAITALVGFWLMRVALVMRLGFIANFISTPVPDGLQGRHRTRDRAGPGAETARHSHQQAGIFSRPSRRRGSHSRGVADHTGGGRCDIRHLDRYGAVVGAFTGAAGRHWWSHCGVVVLRPARRSESRRLD